MSLPGRISDRSAPDWQTRLHFLAFNAFFGLAMLVIHVFQCFAGLLYFVEPLRPIKDQCITLSKRSYGALCVFISQAFAPTRIVLTVDEGLDASSLLVRDDKNDLVLDLPDRNVIMSNHQVYLDWLYIWAFLYFAKFHDSIIIILKASLKWVPIVGPGMQFFSFIFLNRSWEADRKVLHRKLIKLGQRAEANNHPMSLLIFPEGTLVSKDTRPLSKKYAAKMGIDDLRHTLLPRSTGLLFCLRALAQKIPGLKVIDLTIGYPGIPNGGYGQDYYTLQSVFGHGHSPPSLHIHYSLISISDIPIGELPPNGSEREPTEEEKRVFGEWLLSRWKLKDDKLEHFYSAGSFSGATGVASSPPVTLPMRLGRWQDCASLGANFVAGAWLSYEVVRASIARLLGGR